VKFDLLEEEKERKYYKRLPTSFVLEPEQVDDLREVAKKILNNSPEFQRLLDDLR
jgi:NTE family protein